MLYREWVKDLWFGSCEGVRDTRFLHVIAITLLSAESTWQGVGLE